MSYDGPLEWLGLSPRNAHAIYNLGAFWRKRVTCPANFSYVPANTAVGTSADFCVAQFEMKNVGGVATSQPALTPWVSITRNNARTACTDAGFRLISNAEWQTVARSLEATASNWSGGAVGTGLMFRGHSDNNPAGPQAISDSADVYSDTGNTAAQAMGSGKEQRRSMTLANGAVIWDLAGNVWEWVYDDISGNDTTPTVTASSEFTNTTYYPAADTGSRSVFGPLNSTFSKAHYVGYSYGGTAGAVRRGSQAADFSNSGVFTVALLSDRHLSATYLGFRCTTNPQ